MKLEYEFVEDSFDDTTHIRTMTEQAVVEGGILLRTTVYTPHHIGIDVTFLRAEIQKGKKKGFDAIPLKGRSAA